MANLRLDHNDDTLRIWDAKATNTASTLDPLIRSVVTEASILSYDDMTSSEGSYLSLKIFLSSRYSFIP